MIVESARTTEHVLPIILVLATQITLEVDVKFLYALELQPIKLQLVPTMVHVLQSIPALAINLITEMNVNYGTASVLDLTIQVLAPPMVNVLHQIAVNVMQVG
jgi:hypothetical protein